MPNDAQIESWDGAAGERWVEHAERYDRINARFGELIVERLGPAPREHVLDVGCGNGAVALAIAAIVGPGGTVVGVDVSGPMLDNARQRCERAGLENVELVKGDAQVHPLPEARFDAAVSRFGVMFFDDPAEAFANIGRALKPGGRLVFTCWQELLSNEWIVVPVAAALEHVPMPDLGPPGAPGPFALADPERLRGILDEAGFHDVVLDDMSAPMLIGTSVDDAMSFFRTGEIAQRLVADVDDDTAEKAWAAMRAALEQRATPAGVELSGKAWLVSARRPLEP